VTAARPLTGALERVAALATGAGLDREAAVTEAACLAAAVAEASPGAPADWLAQTGADGGTQAFFDAASRGRRWRGAPTALVGELAVTASPHAAAYARALVDVTTAAATLGRPTPRVAGTATLAATAQLLAVGLAGHDGTPSDVPGAMGDLRSPTFPAVPAPDGHAAAAPALAAASAPEPAPAPTRTVEELLAELDALVGLRRVKREVHQQAAVLRMERLRTAGGLRTPTISRHLVFVGNPGTGKTTVARLVAGIYAALGLLAKGHLVEVDREDLVAGYLGQSAIKTSEVIDSARGGVLFIDEAYSLARDQYGQEAVETLLKVMEDDRDELVVIVAGYPDLMGDFLAANPGLSSRMRTTITFEDYSDDELVTIFERLAAGGDFSPADGTVEHLRRILEATERDETFGNGRFVRNVLETAIGNHAWRLRHVDDPTADQLRLLLPTDLVETADDGVPGDGVPGDGVLEDETPDEGERA
jgi:hypothetical protein